MVAPTPVTVITGFLGAGKSTVAAQWLAQLPKRRTAVIVNEQGAIGIDGTLLASKAAQLREITGGCICCRAQAELDEALATFASAKLDPPLTRIVVETSGAASPAGVVRALTQGTARAQLRLDGIVTVLDASRIASAMRFALTQEQLGFADVVLLSHADACTPAALIHARDIASRHAPAAVLAQTVHGRIRGAPTSTLTSLLAARSSALHLPTPEHSGQHGIDSVSFEYPGSLDEARFTTWVESALAPLEARLLRIKGILSIHGVDQRVIVQGVGGAIEVVLGEPWGETPRTSRLVVLGLDLDPPTLQVSFTRCTEA